MNASILVAAGGTGGHIFPALAVADELQKRDIDVVWVGTRSGLEARLVPDAGIDIRWIDITGLRGKGLLSTLGAPLKLIRACWQSIVLVRELQPNAVLGMGGFVTGPIGLASFLLRKPLVLHEQNAVAGMTNRYLSRVAKRVLAALPGAFPTRVKDEVVGNPLRSTIEEHALAFSDSLQEKDITAPLNILIVGGSQGARVLNEQLPKAIDEVSVDINVRHQTGRHDIDSVKRAYEAFARKNLHVEVLPFIDDMIDAYRWSDLVVCRAGAMTVAELAAMGLPSVLVPFPHAVDDHQTKNARYLSESGAAVLMPENHFNSAGLAARITELHHDRSALYNMALAARGCHQANATIHVADALSELT